MYHQSTKLSKYQILCVIGEGAYGKVYKVKNNKNGLLFAMKVIPMINKSPKLSCHVKREIKALQHLKHPNVVSLQEYFKNGDNMYLILEHMEYDLKQYLSINKSSLDMIFIKKTAFQILKGIKCIHDGKILHRDIKSSNILIDKNGLVKIADFGLSRLFSNDDKGFYTQEVVSLGYRAPEILLTQSKYTTALDMWSFGVLLVELVTGKCPFKANNELNMLIEIVKLIGTPNEDCLKELCGEDKRINLGVYENRLLEYILFECNVVMENESSDLWFLVDLAGKCLDFNPNNRVSVDQALQHNFLTY